MTRSLGILTLLVVCACATTSEQTPSAEPAGNAVRGPIIGTANTYALALPPGDLARGSGTGLGWSGSKSGAKKKSSEPLPSYAEAMLKPADLGDLTNEGGEEHLRADTVADIMNGHVNDIFNSCVLKEMKTAKVSRVAIQMVISGKGKVAGATTKPGSKPFQRCVARKLLAIRFPTFSAPRMGAEYAFRVE
ncbi:MAG: hypothetical protein ACN4G0_10665 [Polyangiales bacterium]